MADNQKLIGEIILEDLKVEGIDKVLSLTMLKAFIASPTLRYKIWFRLGSSMKAQKRWMLSDSIGNQDWRRLEISSFW